MLYVFQQGFTNEIPHFDGGYFFMLLTTQVNRALPLGEDGINRRIDCLRFTDSQ